MKTTIFETEHNHLTMSMMIIEQLARGKEVPKSCIAAAKKDMDALVKILDRLEASFNLCLVINQFIELVYFIITCCLRLGRKIWLRKSW